ncbi:MAG: DUF2569 domain-containing protein [Sphingomicrobium sp.]
MLHHVRQRLSARSAALLLTLEGGLPRLMAGWAVLIAAACGLRVMTSPLSGAPASTTLLAYLLLAGAPIVSMVLALRWFEDGGRLGHPKRFIDRRGYRAIGLAAASRHRLYGPGGIMVSLLIGLLLSVVLRAAEYVAALPALSGRVPEWLATLQLVMTLDVVIFSSLYAIAFVAALRKVPLFPRLLAAIWAADLAMQLGIAEAVAGQPGLPVHVAAALHRLLDGNVMKVLMSIALWMPYLLLSKRVNLTYRHRLPR